MMLKKAEQLTGLKLEDIEWKFMGFVRTVRKTKIVFNKGRSNGEGHSTKSQ